VNHQGSCREPPMLGLEGVLWSAMDGGSGPGRMWLRWDNIGGGFQDRNGVDQSWRHLGTEEGQY
jgi:hypothetical protein